MEWTHTHSPIHHSNSKQPSKRCLPERMAIVFKDAKGTYTHREKRVTLSFYFRLENMNSLTGFHKVMEQYIKSFEKGCSQKYVPGGCSLKVVGRRYVCETWKHEWKFINIVRLSLNFIEHFIIINLVMEINVLIIVLESCKNSL